MCGARRCIPAGSRRGRRSRLPAAPLLSRAASSEHAAALGPRGSGSSWGKQLLPCGRCKYLVVLDPRRELGRARLLGALGSRLVPIPHRLGRARRLPMASRARSEREAARAGRLGPGRRTTIHCCPALAPLVAPDLQRHEALLAALPVLLLAMRAETRVASG